MSRTPDGSGRLGRRQVQTVPQVESLGIGQAAVGQNPLDLGDRAEWWPVLAALDRRQAGRRRFVQELLAGGPGEELEEGDALPLGRARVPLGQPGLEIPVEIPAADAVGRPVGLGAKVPHQMPQVHGLAGQVCRRNQWGLGGDELFGQNSDGWHARGLLGPGRRVEQNSAADDEIAGVGLGRDGDLTGVEAVESDFNEVPGGLGGVGVAGLQGFFVLDAGKAEADVENSVLSADVGHFFAPCARTLGSREPGRNNPTRLPHGATRPTHEALMRHRLLIMPVPRRSRIAASPCGSSARATGLEPATTGSTVRSPACHKSFQNRPLCR